MIAGGGIIGASTAYFLTQRGFTNVVIVERFEVAGCASGKSGGFLAGGWGDRRTDQLHRLGFELHEKIAETLGIDSYRRIKTLQVEGSSARSQSNPLCPWLDGAKCELMDNDTAQVTPYELTTKLINEAKKKGAEVLKGEVANVRNAYEEKTNAHRVDRVLLKDGRTLACDMFLVALGPWSVLAEDWFADTSSLSVPMEGIKSSSIVLNHPPGSMQKPFALFCGEDDRFNTHLEIYPRPDGSIYMCGLGGSEHCPKNRIIELTPEMVVPDAKRVKAAVRCFQTYSTSLGKGAPDLTEACMRPAVSDGYPMMGRIPNYSNAFIGCGHNCWGILWGPISGLALSELIIDGKSTTVALKHFDPGRFKRKDSNNRTKTKKRGRKDQNGNEVGEQW